MINCEYVFILVVNNLALPSQTPTLNDSNFSDWKDSWTFVISLLNIDVAIKKPKPCKPIDASSAAEKADLEKWELSNDLCLQLMKNTIAKQFNVTLTSYEDVKNLWMTWKFEQ